MKIGLIIIGDELLAGSTQDCNMLYLGEKLRSIGLTLSHCQVIADQLPSIEQAFKDSLNNFDLTICSGGLGPTIDDRTKLALANFLSVELKENEDAKNLAAIHYSRRGLTWQPALNNYHMIPQGVTAFLNPKGLAPGLYLKINNQKELLCAPGVPREFQAMVDHFFEKNHLDKMAKERAYFSIRTTGIPEEQIFNHKCPNLWRKLSEFGDVSSYPRPTGIDIVISNLKIDSQEFKKLIENLPEIEPIRENIWHLGNGPIEKLIIEFALQHKITISTAESCTGGLIAHLLTEVSGSSGAFWGTVVGYDNRVKENLLQVSSENLKNYGAVSIQVAEQMATGIKLATKTTYAISTTGIAGPLGGSTEKPVGTVCIGIHGPNGVNAKMHQIPTLFDRDEMKKRFATRALITLYRQMKKDFSP